MQEPTGIPIEAEPQQATVLIVDDDESAARGLERTVADLGYRTEVATEWTAAIRTFSTQEIDIVLMDAVMPTVDGFKLTKILRGRATSYVPILFITGLADSAAREQGVAVGADDFLTKPVDPLELKVRLIAMLRIRELTKDLEAKSRALARLASVDALTGLANRRSLEERLPAELERAHRYERPLAVLMMDLDHFKRVNDAYGHAVGDAVLAFFGNLMGEIVRGCDLVYRYGGEEFVVIAPETASKPAVHVAERVRRAFELRSPSATSAGRLTLSVGIDATDLHEGKVDAQTLLGGADTALYRAKNDGRNLVRVFDPLESTLEL